MTSVQARESWDKRAHYCLTKSAILKIGAMDLSALMSSTCDTSSANGRPWTSDVCSTAASVSNDQSAFFQADCILLQVCQTSAGIVFSSAIRTPQPISSDRTLSRNVQAQFLTFELIPNVVTAFHMFFIMPGLWHNKQQGERLSISSAHSGG